MLDFYIASPQKQIVHVVAGCQANLERYTWRCDSIIKFLATQLEQSASRSYVDLPGFKSPSIITSKTYHSDSESLKESKYMGLGLAKTF